MPSNRVLDRHYSLAFYEVKRDEKKVEEGLKDLALVLGVLEKEPSFGVLLSSPLLSNEEKSRLLSKAFEGKVAGDTLFFLNLLSRKKEFTQESLFEIYHHYRHLRNAELGILEGRIYSAFPLNPGQVGALEQGFSRKLGLKVEFRTFLEPRLLGGMRIYLRDRMVDTSLATQLQTVEDNLLYEKKGSF